MNEELEQGLIAATAEFGIAYTVADEAQKEADEAKARFYELADQELATKRLPRRTLQPTALVGDIEEYVKKYWPEWRIVENGPNGVIIERDPSKMKYGFPNPEDGQYYQRTTQDKGKPAVDVEQLKEEDPKLWEGVSEWDPGTYKLVEAAVVYAMPLKPGKAELKALLDTFFRDIRPEARVLKPSVAWSQSQSGRLQKYLIPPGITVKIVKPRPVKEEDLVEDE